MTTHPTFFTARRVVSLTSLLAALVLLSGCYVRGGGRATARASYSYSTPQAVYVSQPPPNLRQAVNTRPPRPSGSSVWVAGHWRWQGRWTWQAGSWATPRNGHVWTPPVCVRSGARYEYHPGYWRRPAAAPPQVYQRPGTVRVSVAPSHRVYQGGGTVRVSSGSPAAGGTVRVQGGGQGTVRVQPGSQGGGTVRVQPGSQGGGTVRVQPGSQGGGTVRVQGGSGTQGGGTVRVQGGSGTQGGGTVRVQGGSGTQGGGTVRVQGGSGTQGGSVRVQGTTRTATPGTANPGAVRVQGTTRTATPGTANPGAVQVQGTTRTVNPGTVQGRVHVSPNGTTSQPVLPQQQGRPVQNGATLQVSGTRGTVEAQPAVPQIQLTCSMNTGTAPRNGYITLTGNGIAASGAVVTIGGRSAVISARQTNRLRVQVPGTSGGGRVVVTHQGRSASCGMLNVR